MDSRDLIRLIRSNTEEIKSDGGTSVTIASLETLLSAAENELEDGKLPVAAIEHIKLQHASNLATYAAQSASSLELFKSVIETAKMTVTSLILINGGSAVALLAFIGHLASTEKPRIPVSSFAQPLLYFVIGVGAAALFAGFISLGQKLYLERWLRCGHIAISISVLIGFSSFAAFAAGSYFGYRVFAGM